jgi:methylase of polypeptide subunit release factors
MQEGNVLQLDAVFKSDRSTFDVILANPPYIPSTVPSSSTNTSNDDDVTDASSQSSVLLKYGDGGSLGEDITQGIFNQIR